MLLGEMTIRFARLVLSVVVLTVAPSPSGAQETQTSKLREFVTWGDIDGDSLLLPVIDLHSDQDTNRSIDARRLILVGRYHQAIALLDSALNEHRRMPDLWFYKGLAHAKLRDLRTALKCLDRAISYKDSISEFHIDKGIIAIRLLHYRQSQKDFLAALQIAEHALDSRLQGEALYWLARSSQALSRPDSARTYYRRAVHLNPALNKAEWRLKTMKTDSLYAAAQNALSSEDFELAQSVLQSVFEMTPDYRDVAELLIFLREQSEDRNLQAGAHGLPMVSAGGLERSMVTFSENQAKDQSLTIPVEFDVAADSQSAHVQPAPPFQVPRDVEDESGVWLHGVLGLGGISLLSGLLYLTYRRRAGGGSTPPIPISSLADFNKYEIETEIGRGAMGIVYKARDLKLKRTIALKVIRFENVKDEQDRRERIARFHQEARATARLDHPNIVRLHDYDETDDNFYMTMEYVAGQSLSKVLEGGRLDIQRAIGIFGQILHGLDYAHQRHIVHRDIKPGNIMLRENDTVKILDFGLVKVLNANKNFALTNPDARVGAPYYMSPEQINAERVDARSDIFSLGVVFYEMLTGERPFKADAETSMAQLFNEVLNSSPPTVRTLRSEVPPGLDAVVSKMLAKEPVMRFQNVAEVIASL